MITAQSFEVKHTTGGMTLKQIEKSMNEQVFYFSSIKKKMLIPAAEQLMENLKFGDDRETSNSIQFLFVTLLPSLNLNGLSTSYTRHNSVKLRIVFGTKGRLIEALSGCKWSFNPS